MSQKERVDIVIGDNSFEVHQGGEPVIQDARSFAVACEVQEGMAGDMEQDD